MNVIVLISSLNRDDLAAACAAAVVEGVCRAGGQAEEVWLDDLQVGPCRACDDGRGSCLPDHHCRVQDAFQALHAGVLQADAYALVTPVYEGEVSGSARAFIERLRRCEAMRDHGSGLSGKPVIAVAAAGDGGNGMMTCLLGMERWISHVHARKFDLIPVNRCSRQLKLVTIRESATMMVEAGGR